jgi:hypothetical protein
MNDIRQGQVDEEWMLSGGLPPDDGKEMIDRLAADVSEGNIPESKRAKIATNAVYEHSIGKINDALLARVLQAVQVDENGDLMRPEGDPIVDNTNLSDV